MPLEQPVIEVTAHALPLNLQTFSYQPKSIINKP